MNDKCYSSDDCTLKFSADGPLQQAMLHRDDYIEGARRLVDCDTVDGIMSKSQFGVAGYWQRTFGCTKNEIDCSLLTQFLKGRSIGSLAKQMGVTKGPIYTRIHRAIFRIQRSDPLLQDSQDLAEAFSGPGSPPTLLYRGASGQVGLNRSRLFSFRRKVRF